MLWRHCAGIFIEKRSSATLGRGIVVYLSTSSEVSTAARMSLNGGNLTATGAIRDSQPSMATHLRMGALGSHYTVLESARSKDVTIHIMEVDVDLSPQVERIICSLMRAVLSMTSILFSRIRRWTWI